MKIKTADLQGIVLDRAVGKCERLDMWNDCCQILLVGDDEPYHPSTDWAQGGPITEREGISTVFQGDGHEWVASLWDYETEDWRLHTTGPTPLIAAMRCYIYAELGDEVEVPEELCTS